MRLILKCVTLTLLDSAIAYQPRTIYKKALNWIEVILEYILSGIFFPHKASLKYGKIMHLLVTAKSDFLYNNSRIGHK